MKHYFIGWCKEGNHDKVWGLIELQEFKYYGKREFLTVWGRRGAKLQTKLVQLDSHEVNKLCDQKINRGYVELETKELEDVYPEFRTDLEKTALWAALKF